ncbi:MAG: ATP-binding cassette domain-containing protein [Cyclobacteriaceae bacterium]
MGLETVLNIDNLSKRFGKIQAVSDLSLEIKPGEVFGLLGPNGSGKTTTLGMILDVVAPTSGTFNWFGGLPNVEARKRIGSILETPCFYPYLSAVQNLKIAAHIKQCPSSRIEAVLEQVNLIERKDDNFKTFSLGMKQRLSIAAALLGDPPVLILDEPTNGLDPEGIAEVRALIKDISQQGKTIILASHLLDEVQKVCTHFCVLRKGVKLHQGPVSDTTGEISTIEISAKNLDNLEQIVSTADWFTSARKENGSLFIDITENTTSEDVNKFCFDKGVSLTRLITLTNSLEQEFLKILKEND